MRQSSTSQCFGWRWIELDRSSRKLFERSGWLCCQRQMPNFFPRAAQRTLLFSCPKINTSQKNLSCKSFQKEPAFAQSFKIQFVLFENDSGVRCYQGRSKRRGKACGVSGAGLTGLNVVHTIWAKGIALSWGSVLYGKYLDSAEMVVVGEVLAWARCI